MSICIHHRFEVCVRKNPTAVALRFKNSSLTYAELNERSDQLALRLRSLGVTPHSLVGVCLDRSFDLIIGILAILKAGGAYVPLDPTYPAERLAFMAEDAALPVIITERHLRAKIPGFTKAWVLMDSEPDAPPAENSPGMASEGNGQDLAYVIYTSGSTGKPKGVKVAHESVTHLIDVTRSLLDFSSEDTWSFFHSYAFDLSVWEIFGCLLNGGRLVIVPAEVARSPREFLGLVEREGVTILNQTPSALRQLIHSAQTPSSTFQQTRVRAVLSGGESLPPSLARTVLESGIPLWNFYGPTEATVWVTAGPVEPTDPDRAVIPVGRPFSGVKLFVLDENLQLVPPGSTGELYLGGICLAKGYLNRPDLTARAFIAEPFGDHPSTVIYKTGDRARIRDDGRLEVLGRLDHQVKIRGFRLELGEIQGTIEQHPAIRASAVLARDDGSGDQRLVGYYVPENGAVCPDHELRTFLAARLPAYMIPDAFVPMRSFPVTANDKIDWNALPSPFVNGSGGGAIHDRDALEKELIEIWEEVLGVHPIGVQDSFFDLGGQSLIAVQLAIAIETRCNIPVPLAAVYEFPTIAKLAARLLENPMATKDETLVPLNTSGTKPPLFFINGLLNLAVHLGPDQPFYGVTLMSMMEERTSPKGAIEAMARECIEIVKTVQAHGPYYLGGYSLGGPVVFEMAHQLRQSGEDIAMLALIDPDPPKSSIADRVRRLADRCAFHGRRLLYEMSWSERMEHLAGVLRRSQKEKAEQVHAAYNFSSLPTREKMDSLTETYQPPEAPCRFMLLVAHGEFKFRKSLYDTRWNWRNVAAHGVDVCEMSGDHPSLADEPHVSDVASLLKPYLAAAQISRSATPPRPLSELIKSGGTLLSMTLPFPALLFC